MLRMISPKAFIVSNVAHWVFFMVGVILAISLYAAGATISSDGTATPAAIFADMKSSSTFLIVTALIFFLAPAPAGYIAAKIAPHEKLLNGALSVAVWLLFCFYHVIWGSHSGSGGAHLPHWLDSLATYGVPIPAMFGAYIWHVRADRGAFATTAAHQVNHAAEDAERTTSAPPAVSKQDRVRRFGRAGSGLGMFIFLLMHFLLTQHEQNVLLIAMVTAFALLAAIAFTVKAFKRTSG